MVVTSHKFKHCFETWVWNAQKGAIQNRVSLETRFWKSYKRNSNFKHGLNDVTMIDIENRVPCLTSLPRDKLRRMRCAVAQPETWSKEKTLIICSSVNLCFKTVFEIHVSKLWYSVNAVLLCSSPSKLPCPSRIHSLKQALWYVSQSFGLSPDV